jgi:hypothetical protein
VYATDLVANLLEATASIFIFLLYNQFGVKYFCKNRLGAIVAKSSFWAGALAGVCVKPLQKSRRNLRVISEKERVHFFSGG